MGVRVPGNTSSSAVNLEKCSGMYPRHKNGTDAFVYNTIRYYYVFILFHGDAAKCPLVHENVPSAFLYSLSIVQWPQVWGGGIQGLSITFARAILVML